MITSINEYKLEQLIDKKINEKLNSMNLVKKTIKHSKFRKVNEALSLSEKKRFIDMRTLIDGIILDKAGKIDNRKYDLVFNHYADALLQDVYDFHDEEEVEELGLRDEPGSTVIFDYYSIAPYPTRNVPYSDLSTIVAAYLVTYNLDKDKGAMEFLNNLKAKAI